MKSITLQKKAFKTIVLLLFFVLLLSMFAYAKPIKFAVCKRVVDGDTIELVDNTRVRLIGINSPESNELDYFTAFLNLHLKIKGKAIRLEYDPANEHNNHLGKYGRLLAYVYLNDVFINEEIIKDGCARVYLKYPFDEIKQLQLKKAEKYARDNKLGIWKPFEKDKINNTDELTEIEKLKQKAENGNADAQFDLGTRYASGEGILKDCKKAVFWFRKASKQENSQAQYSLGICYAFGRGVTKNYKKAFFCYKKAAEQNNADAQYNFGVCYHKGYGVSQNKKKSVYWFKKSAEQGHADAQYNLGNSYFSGEGILKDIEKAILWYKKAAQQNNVSAQYKLGCFYDKTKKMDKAICWYKKAAQQGERNAQYIIGGCYENGKGVTQDYQKAVSWYERAGENDNKKAQLLLANYYNHLKEYDKAIYWFKKCDKLREVNKIKKKQADDEFNKRYADDFVSIDSIESAKAKVKDDKYRETTPEHEYTESERIADLNREKRAKNMGIPLMRGAPRENQSGTTGFGNNENNRNNENIRCHICNGSGKIDCANINCQNGKIKCSFCWGRGKCTNCNSSGWKKCSTCEGKGLHKCNKCLGTGIIERQNY